MGSCSSNCQGNVCPCKSLVQNSLESSEPIVVYLAQTLSIHHGDDVKSTAKEITEKLTTEDFASSAPVVKAVAQQLNAKIVERVGEVEFDNFKVEEVPAALKNIFGDDKAKTVAKDVIALFALAQF